MANGLDREFTFRTLLGFALPSIVMMIFTSLYTIVDGMFISRFVGEDALAAVNIAFPALCLVMAVGIMLATGGSAIVAHRMGAGDGTGARQGLTLLLLVSLGIGILFAPSFLFAGLNIFASAFFTALGDGKISALISFLRTFGFLLAGLVVLPALFGVDGVWLAVPWAEILCAVVSLLLLRRGREKYRYG